MIGFVRPRRRSRGRHYFQGVALRRPHSFKRFIRKNSFHSIYLITTEIGNPVKVGIAEDHLQRLAALQVAHFAQLQLYRFWWMPGKLITERIESAFKDQFASENIRGEWFDLPLPVAEAFIESGIRKLGTWGVRQSDIVGLMDHWERRKYGIPPEAPTPLRGIK